MRKLFIILLLIVLVIFGWVFRYELLFNFQYARLKGLACQQQKANFINDSCLNKLWAHRVNSTERYNVLKGNFAGYETDIAWDSSQSKFMVYHPPLKETAITLSNFLSKVDLKASMLWLDTRETSASDTANIVRVFDSLNDQYNLKMNVILELYDTAVANYLANKGYWVALNIHPQWISEYTVEEWETFKSTISPKISFVSQEDVHVPFLEKQFPGKDIITWSINFNNYFNRKHLRQLVQNDCVKVVLVNIKSKHYK